MVFSGIQKIPGPQNKRTINECRSDDGDCVDGSLSAASSAVFWGGVGVGGFEIVSVPYIKSNSALSKSMGGLLAGVIAGIINALIRKVFVLSI